MPAAIRIYFEGHKLLKPGFNAFFKELRERAHDKRIGWQLINAKSGEEAQRDFELALEHHPGSWNVLLRDSEGPLPRGRRSHASQVFWMVEMMEAWFHAGPDAVEKFYGAGFRRKSLKANPNVESIPKADLERGLKAATGGSKMGDYFDHKTSHGPQLLAAIDPARVRYAAPNCDRLFRAVIAHLT